MLKNDFLRYKIEAMEKQYNEQFKSVFEAIRRLLDDKETSKTEIGFKVK